jgi:hypothetical protein
MVDAKEVGRRAINYCDILVTANHAMLNERPPYCLEPSLRHRLQFVYAVLVAKIQMLYRTKDIPTLVYGNKPLVVFLRRLIVGIVIVQQGRRSAQREDTESSVGEIRSKVLPVAVIIVPEEEQGVDNVPAHGQCLVWSDCRRDATKFGITDEDGREKEWPIAIRLGGPGQHGTMNT